MKIVNTWSISTLLSLDADIRLETEVIYVPNTLPNLIYLTGSFIHGVGSNIRVKMPLFLEAVMVKEKTRLARKAIVVVSERERIVPYFRKYIHVQITPAAHPSSSEGRPTE